MAELNDTAVVLVMGGLGLFWIGMLGLLWRRSLIGMMIGLLFLWISVAIAGFGFGALHSGSESGALSGAFVLCVSILSILQIAVGLAIVVARIRRHGTLDADDAGLLEG